MNGFSEGDLGHGMNLDSSNMNYINTHRVGIIGFDEANLLDIAGPTQVFTTAAEKIATECLHGSHAYNVTLLAPGVPSFKTSSGLVFECAPLEQHDPAIFNTILVSGGYGIDREIQNRETLDWLQAAAENRVRLGSICTGAFLLAAAGLLKGRRAATHWGYCDRLMSRHPEIQVERDAIYVEDQGIWTSAGVTAGMDLALALVERDWGRHIALSVARHLVIFLKRPGGQSQFSVPLVVQSQQAGPLASLLSWISENPDKDLRISSLADRARMTERTLHRLFIECLNQPPARFVEQVRLEYARGLLQDPEFDLATIARKSGFGSSERLRRAFYRRFGTTPSEYRARFPIDSIP